MTKNCCNSISSPLVKWEVTFLGLSWCAVTTLNSEPSIDHFWLSNQFNIGLYQSFIRFWHTQHLVKIRINFDWISALSFLSNILGHPFGLPLVQHFFILLLGEYALRLWRSLIFQIHLLNISYLLLDINVFFNWVLHYGFCVIIIRFIILIILNPWILEGWIVTRFLIQSFVIIGCGWLLFFVSCCRYCR